MELRHLRYFLAVAEHGNFTRAASALGIQQPPLSQQVRNLERELGFDLFRRLPRGVELTVGGAVFREEATAMLAALHRGARRGAQAASGKTGSLVMGFTSSAATHRLTPVLIRRFREAYPEVELAIREGNAATVTDAVESGRLDVGMIRRPVSERSGLFYSAVVEEPLLVAMSRDHPLAVRARARGAGTVRLRDLANESFILVRRPGAPGMYGDLIAACHEAGFAPKVVAEVGQMLANLTLVAAGVGVSVVPASMRDIHRDAVFYAQARDAPQLVAPLSLVTRIGQANPAVANLLDLARVLGAEATAPARSRPASGAIRGGASRPTKRRSRAPARRP